MYDFLPVLIFFFLVFVWKWTLLKFELAYNIQNISHYVNATPPMWKEDAKR